MPEQEMSVDEAWAANLKRDFDRFGAHQDKLISDAQSQLNAVNQVSLQILNNMQENANAMSKQLIRHADVAIDRTWNVDEQSMIVEKILSDKKLQDGMFSLAAKAIGDAINATKPIA